MKKIKKILIITILLFIISACGANNTEKNEEASTNNDEQVSEIVSTRNIVVSKIVGDVLVTHENGEKLDAYEGMNLYDGDDVIVSESSNVTLTIDSDKHLFADENSHFWLTATGNENNSKTLIHLEAGSVLCDIKEKLKKDETFDIQTASSTMSVRGTVFRVCLLNGKDNSIFDLVEVYDGKVWSNIDNTEDNVTLEPGQCALIRKNQSKEEDAFYVVEEDLNTKFVEETGLKISLENVDGQEKGALKLSLENVPVETLSRLVEIIDEGTDLVIDKEEIQKVEETKKQEEVKEELIENHEHNFVVSSRTNSTCVANGVVTYRCSVCGETKTEYLPLAEHTPTKVHGHSATCTENGKSDGVVCSVCGKVLESQSTIKATGHKDVLDADGITHKCSVCGKILSVDVPNDQYTIISFNDGAIAAATFSAERINNNTVINYEINGATLSFVSEDGSSTSTINDATVNVVYTFSPSDLLKTNPDVDAKYLYKESEIDATKDVSDSIGASLDKNILLALAERFSAFSISSLPDTLTNENASVIRKEIPDGNLNYQVTVSLTASSTFSKIAKNGSFGTTINVPVNYNFIIDLFYDANGEGCTNVESWTINTYCFNKNLLSHSGGNGDAINTHFSPSELYDSFIVKVKDYANDIIRNMVD